MSDLPLGLLPTAPSHYGKPLLAAVRKLEREPLARVINRLTRYERMSQSDAERARLEFLRFYSLFHLGKGPYTSTLLADKFTHSFMLFSRDYEKFCQRHFGQFIHHEPNDYPSERNPKIRDRTVELLGALYGFKLKIRGKIDRVECNGEGTGACNDEGTGSIVTLGRARLSIRWTLRNLA
jgi:hypothetical protein